MSETKAREAICRLGASIFARGLTFGNSGNISQRMEDGWLMTPTNASLGELDPAKLSRLDRNGRLLSGDPPTKEAFLHRVMYDGRKDAEAVLHLHSIHSVAVSCLADTDASDRGRTSALLNGRRPGRLAENGTRFEPMPFPGDGPADWVRELLSGPKGGDAEIAQEVVAGRCRRAVFFEDPHVAREHEAGIQLLERATRFAAKGCLCMSNPAMAGRWIENMKALLR